MCVTVYNNYYFSNGSFDQAQQPDTQEYAYDEVEDGQQQQQQQQEYYEESDEEEEDGMWQQQQQQYQYQQQQIQR